MLASSGCTLGVSPVLSDSQGTVHSVLTRQPVADVTVRTRHYRGEGNACSQVLLHTEQTSTDEHGVWDTPGTYELVFETFLPDSRKIYYSPCVRYDLPQHPEVPVLTHSRRDAPRSSHGPTLKLSVTGGSRGDTYVRLLAGLLTVSDQLLATYVGAVLLFKPNTPQFGLRLVAQPGIWGGAVALGLRGTIGITQWDVSARVLRYWRLEREQTRIGSELGFELVIFRAAVGFMHTLDRRLGEPDYVVLGSIGLVVLL